MTAGMFDRYSCQDNGKEFGIIRQYSDQYVSHAECEVRVRQFRLATRYPLVGPRH